MAQEYKAQIVITLEGVYHTPADARAAAKRGIEQLRQIDGRANANAQVVWLNPTPE